MALIKSYKVQVTAGLIIIICNIADAMLTLMAVGGGYAVEANPIVDEILLYNPFVFLLAKLLIPCVVVLGYYYYLSKRTTQRVTFVDIFVYACAAAYVALLCFLLINTIAIINTTSLIDFTTRWYVYPV